MIDYSSKTTGHLGLVIWMSSVACWNGQTLDTCSTASVKLPAGLCLQSNVTVKEKLPRLSVTSVVGSSIMRTSNLWHIMDLKIRVTIRKRSKFVQFQLIVSNFGSALPAMVYLQLALCACRFRPEEVISCEGISFTQRPWWKRLISNIRCNGSCR